MTLWYVQCEDGGENFDLFVQCLTRAGAVETWVLYYEFEDVPRHRVMNLTDAVRDPVTGVLEWNLVEAPL